MFSLTVLEVRNSGLVSWANTKVLMELVPLKALGPVLTLYRVWKLPACLGCDSFFASFQLLFLLPFLSQISLYLLLIGHL